MLSLLWSAFSPALPELSPAEVHKLKSLSLVSLASSSAPSHCLPYPLLLQALSLPSIPELEQLIIAAIDSSLLSARIDQRHRSLRIDSVMGRDLAPGQLDDVRQRVRAWVSSVGSVLQELERRMEEAREAERSERQRTSREEEERERVADMLKQYRDGAAAGSSTQQVQQQQQAAGQGAARLDPAMLQAINIVTGGKERRDGGAAAGGGGREREQREGKLRKRGGFFGRG